MSDRPPASVARKINREIVVLIGWGRAILLQLAHPLVAAAISDNSAFHSGVGGYARRAHQTIGAMLDLTFGTPEEAQRIVDRINGIHDRVNGRLGPATGRFQGGTLYSARDAKLLIWVHATLVESLTLTYELLVGPLTEDERNRYAAEASWLTHELGAPTEAIPASYADVVAFMKDARARGEIAVGDTGRHMARALLAPPLWIAAPVFSVSRLMTIGMLPDDIRREYGFDWDERRERRFKRASALIRGTRRTLPRMFREWPAARNTDRL